ncbi:hypothetical protein [Deinococcus koreensis]|uniref:Uncharacterized protein n=1 Tax=Deinococcus koreensis TaxID=2054903 RepID=A0A2K3UW00_9DEIO|nr:hypothetical protein [Deinococcus koreensis]PNY80696.1 hypothetical protein CVO96_04350 [Deinococcus koreensis]
MKRLVMAAATALFMSAGAGAQQGAASSFDTEFPGLNPCTGETVAYSGTFRFVSTPSRVGRSSVTLHFTGIGSLGNRYVFQDVLHETSRSGTDGSSEYESAEKSLVISSTNAPNYLLTVRTTLTYNPLTGMYTNVWMNKESCTGK